MTFDEYFVRELQVAIGGSVKVFHLEVFQKIPSNNQFPCVVYQLTDDSPEEELEANPGFLEATFSCVVIANNSASLRAIAEAIKAYFNNLTYIDALYCETEGKITWMKEMNDSEENIFAMEQQEKGKQTTVLQVAMDHWQPA